MSENLSPVEGVRGSGRTTKQMNDAPIGSIFIWCNHHTDYPKKLAQKLGRNDIVVVSPSWLSIEHWAGRSFPGIVLDHAADLTESQWHMYERAMDRVRL